MILVKLLLYFVVLVGILCLAYYTTKLIGKTAGVRQASANIRVLEKVAVGKESFLLIVKVQDQIFLYGLTPQGITKLSELSEYDESALPETEDFGAVLTKQMKTNLNQLKSRYKDRGDKS